MFDEVFSFFSGTSGVIIGLVEYRVFKQLVNFCVKFLFSKYKALTSLSFLFSISRYNFLTTLVKAAKSPILHSGQSPP